MARNSRGRRRGPTDPQAILLRAAEDRARARLAEKDPRQWGIQAEILKLPANDAVRARQDPHRRGRIAEAERLDAFDSLHRAGGLPDGEYQAAQRYFRLWAKRAGARMGPTPSADLMTVIDGDGGLDGGMTMARIAAGARIERVHGEIGAADARLLEALVRPLAHGIETIDWRTVVAAVTGEREKHAQGARVRAACENLRLGFEAIDQGKGKPPRTSAY